VKIQVKVKPNSKIQELSQEGNSYTVKIKEPAKEGRANQAVVELLAEHFGVPKSQARILSGFKSKNKVIEIAEE
jgi:uncharacterized protein (TIGR00251 family)